MPTKRKQTKKYNRIKSHLVLRTKKLAPIEKRYCSCLMKVRGRGIKNPYGICTAAVYTKQGETRDERRKNIPEHKGFKIPKKVKSIPTIYNGNRIEWSPIQSGIVRVVNKIGHLQSRSPFC